MSTLSEIKAAIDQLPEEEIEELIEWLANRKARKMSPEEIEKWLASVQGTARPGVTTAGVMATTRSEE